MHITPGPSRRPACFSWGIPITSRLSPVQPPTRLQTSTSLRLHLRMFSPMCMWPGCPPGTQQMWMPWSTSSWTMSGMKIWEPDGMTRPVSWHRRTQARRAKLRTMPALLIISSPQGSHVTPFTPAREATPPISSTISMQAGPHASIPVTAAPPAGQNLLSASAISIAL